jgi:MYXO-CTERM domain-containing protein
MRRVFLFTAFLLLLSASCAVADTVLITTPLTYLTAGGGTWSGYYSYPYMAQVAGQTDPIQVLCDDFVDEIQNGESWSVYSITLTRSALTAIGSGELPSYFGTQSNGIALYEQAAHIFTQIVSGQASASSGNAAIWKLFDAGLDISGDATAQQILAEAAIWLDSLNGTTASFDNVAILVPDLSAPITNRVGSYRPQEFITAVGSGGFNNNSTGDTPEPATALPVLGAGLALAAFGRRRARNHRV